MDEEVPIKRQKNSKMGIIDCGICNSRLQDPRMLNCFHSFCLKCITDFCKDKQFEETLNCPVCCTEFKIPSDRFDAVPVSDVISNPIKDEKKKIISSPVKVEIKNENKEILSNPVKVVNKKISQCDDSNKRLCDKCLLLDDKEPAVVYCADCVQDMCDSCFTKHKDLRGSSTHKIYNLNRKNQMDSLPDHCPDHPNSPKKWYCQTCVEILCNVCVKSKGHQDHNCWFIKTAASHFSNVISYKLANWSVFINQFISDTGESLKRIDSSLEDFEEQIKTARCDIKQRYENMKVLLEKHYKELNENLDLIESERKRELERMRDVGKQEMLMLESLERQWNEVKARGSYCDITRVGSRFPQRIENAVRQHEESMRKDRVQKSQKKFHIVEFEPAETFTMDSGKNILGSVRSAVNDLYKLCPDFKVLLNCNGQNYNIDGKYFLHGIAINNNEVYLTSTGTPHVLVYSLQNLSTVSRQISVPGLTQARGLVYNESDFCLYASNLLPGHIYKINIRDDSVTGWATQIEEPWGLSISKQKNLLVSYIISGQIDEFNGSGQLIRSIKLTDDITGISHAIELESGSFIICQWKPVHRICLVGASGEVMKSYGCRTGVKSISCPRHVALDAEGNILVSAGANDRLIILSRFLKWVGNINTNDNPTSCCWDKENQRLLVTTNSNNFHVITPPTI